MANVRTHEGALTPALLDRVPGHAREAARGVAGAFARYHQAKLSGAAQVPEGPALLVGNHGLYGYDTPVFFYLLHAATGRYPLGLADHAFFKIPLVRTVLPWLGGLRGTRDEALRALSARNLVVCYPGGAREVFKPPEARYRLRWETSLGFARVAAHAQVPVVPFAGAGVDDTFVVLDKSRYAVKLAANPKYTLPVGLPLPLPTRMHFRIGTPVPPPPPDADASVLSAYRDEIAAAVLALLGAGHA